MEIVSDEEPEDDLDLDVGGLNLDGHRVEEDESTVGEVYSKAVGDRTFQKFARRVERAPEQILRYHPVPRPPALHTILFRSSRPGLLMQGDTFD